MEAQRDALKGAALADCTEAGVTVLGRCLRTCYKLSRRAGSIICRVADCLSGLARKNFSLCSKISNFFKKTQPNGRIKIAIDSKKNRCAAFCRDARMAGHWRQKLLSKNPEMDYILLTSSSTFCFEEPGHHSGPGPRGGGGFSLLSSHVAWHAADCGFGFHHYTIVCFQHRDDFCVELKVASAALHSS